MQMKITAMSVIVAMMLTACAGKESHKVAALQKNDKHLGCAEVKLEINEAQFYRAEAERNKRPGVGSLVMPVGYISTYMDAEEAVQSADSRIEYLNRIYEIVGCEKADDAAQAMPVGMVQQQPAQEPRGGVRAEVSSATPYVGTFPGVANAQPQPGWMPVGYTTPFANPQYVTTLPSAQMQGVSQVYMMPAQSVDW